VLDLKNLQATAIIAALALVVSLVSLAFSIYNILRDKARLQVKCEFFEPSEYGKGHIQISIANAGRRPIILRLLGYEGADDWVGSFLGNNERGVRLGEHERHEVNIDSDDLEQRRVVHDIIVTTIWIEDSLGRRHRIKGIEKQIQQLRETGPALQL
jgi:hypothetical protein